MRLQSKLTLFNAVSKIIILLLLVAVLPPLIHTVALHITDQRLQQKKEQVIRIIEEQGIESFVSGGEENAYGSYNLLKEEFISIEQIDLAEAVDTIQNSLWNVEGEVVEYRVMSLAFEIESKTYLMEIGRSLDTIRETSNTLQKYALFFLLAVVAFTVFVDLAFMKILLRPLTHIIKHLQLIGHPGTFEARKLQTTTSDFIYLNSTINAMMGQIQTAFLKEKEFIGNVSHELLTPVSILQTRLENLLADPAMPEHLLIKLVESQRTLHRLKNITQALLLISRIENEQYLKNETVEVSHLVDELSEEIGERAEAREIALELALEHDWVLPQANHSLLFTMLFNVVNNAIKYNKPGGKITISGKQVKKGYQLCVRDTGVGIPEEKLPLIFTRFKRLHAPDGESHGLGLAIVHTVAQFHGIHVSVKSKLGEGTTFCFQFKDSAIQNTSNTMFSPPNQEKVLLSE